MLNYARNERVASKFDSQSMEVVYLLSIELITVDFRESGLLNSIETVENGLESECCKAGLPYRLFDPTRLSLTLGER